MRKIIGILFLAAAGAWAQQPNTVTANVSTTATLTAGTATFGVQFLDANLASVVDTALNVLAGAGIGTSNLTGVSVSLSQGFVITQYDFRLPVAAGEYAATRDKLIAAQRAIANVNSQALSWNTTFEASQEERARMLSEALPGLLDRARTQAEVLAGAIGMKLGAVHSVAPVVSVGGLNATVTLAVTYVVGTP